MGNALGFVEPITHKETFQDESDSIWLGVTAVQGWRIDMEDAHTWKLGKSGASSGMSLFAVLDGHGGPSVANTASKLLASKIDDGNCEAVSGSSESEQATVDMLQESIMSIERELLNDNCNSESARHDLCGSTCLVVLLKDAKLFCANVGDSRAVASVDGRPVQLSIEHKPYHQTEEARIIAAGAYIESNRVNGNLALSRALGDFFFKRAADKPLEEQAISAFSDVSVFELDAQYEFLVVACDGIWDVMSNDEVIDFCRLRLADGLTPAAVAEDLSMHCMAPDCSMGGLGCDNMTVMIVCLMPDGRKESVAPRLARPIAVEASRAVPRRCRHYTLNDFIRRRDAGIGLGTWA